MEFPSQKPHDFNMVAKGDIEKLDAVRRLILRRVEMERPRLNLKWLSKQLSRHESYLREFIWKGVPRVLDTDDRIKLATLLGVVEAELREPRVDMHTPSRSQRVVAVSSQGSVRLPRETQGSFPWPKDLRVLGYVKAGQVGYYPDNGETLEMTERPPSLIGVPDAYAVYIDDVSMVPALKPGYLAWVHPRKPAMPGDNVIVQLHDGQAFVKELVRRTEKQVICRQWNPVEEVRYAAADVKAVHLVDGAKFGR